MPRQIGSHDLVTRGEGIEFAIPEASVWQATVDEYKDRFARAGR